MNNKAALVLSFTAIIVSALALAFNSAQQCVVISDQEAKVIMRADELVRNTPEVRDLVRKEIEKNLSREFSKKGINITQFSLNPLRPSIPKSKPIVCITLRLRASACCWCYSCPFFGS